MEHQLTGLHHLDNMDRMTPLLLTEMHLTDWLRLLDYLQDTHAPHDELVFCRAQVTRLQLDLYRLRNGKN